MNADKNQGTDPEKEKTEEEIPKVYFYLGSVPVDDEFVDNLGRGGAHKAG